MDSSLGFLGALRAQFATLLTAVYACLMVTAWHTGPDPQSRWFLVVACLLAITAWLMALRRARAIVDLPVARIGSAAQGYVQLKGITHSDSGNPVFSTYGRKACVWYRYHLYDKDNSDRKWREVDSGVSSATFELADDSGSCRVDPDDAEVVGVQRSTTYLGNNKLVEELLLAGDEVFVLGEFTTVGGAGLALNPREDLDRLLTQWKADRPALVRRFDTNRNGELDPQEWEQARKLAVETVEQQHRELRQQPGLDIVRKPASGSLFLISPLSPTKLRVRFLLWACVHAASAIGAVFLMARLG